MMGLLERSSKAGVSEGKGGQWLGGRSVGGGKRGERPPPPTKSVVAALGCALA